MAVGIDLVMVSRVEASLARFGQRFLRRVFTDTEIAYATSVPGLPAERLAARFGQRFAADLPWITGEGLSFYHAWAFATVRQLGAGFELAALHLEWLGDDALAPAATAFSALSQTAKIFILKAARAVNAKRALDARPMFDEMAAAWQTGMDTLTARLP